MVKIKRTLIIKLWEGKILASQENSLFYKRRIKELERQNAQLRLSRKVLINLVSKIENEKKNLDLQLNREKKQLQQSKRRYAKWLMQNNYRYMELQAVFEKEKTAHKKD